MQNTLPCQIQVNVCIFKFTVWLAQIEWGGPKNLDYAIYDLNVSNFKKKNYNRSNFGHVGAIFFVLVDLSYITKPTFWPYFFFVKIRETTFPNFGHKIC